MKLHLEVLQRLIELPAFQAPKDQSTDRAELRALLDDLGLEVKDVETDGQKTVFTIETLANRGDHLHALGVAREISGRLLTPLKLPSVVADISDRKASLPVRRATNKCLRYSLMEMSLPKGMPLRPDVASVVSSEDKHPIVDILNNVQLELGQPMHAFDRDKVEGEVSIELSDKEEEIEALDGRSYKAPPGSILIKDKRKILAVGGVIGCASSMVTTETTRVLVEAACFDPVCVRKTARGMGIATDAAFVFERGTDPEGIQFALRRVVHLVSGSMVSDTQSAHVIGLTATESEPLEKRQVPLRIANVRKQLNSPRLEEVEITTRLKNLGFVLAAEGSAEGKAAAANRTFRATVPSWRIWDIRNEEDLIEEFARAHGLNKIKLSLPPLDYERAEKDPVDAIRDAIEPAVHGAGFYEVITRSFYSMEEVRLLSELDPAILSRHVSLKNSVEKGISHMRANNIVQLGRLAEQSLRKGVTTCKIYEIGRVFSSEKLEGRYEYERDVLSLAVYGRWFDDEYQKAASTEETARLFKGALESVFRALGAPVQAVPSAEPMLHPGFQAALRSGRVTCGYFGLVHPRLKEGLEMKQDLLYAELDMQQLARIKSTPEYNPPTDFPAIRRDVTLRIGLRDPAGDVIRQVLEQKAENLRDIEIVDHFRKPEEDFRRVTYRMTFQNPERTLEHAEVDKAVESILGRLAEKHGLGLA